MDKFTVEKRGPGQACFVKMEGGALRIELADPADFQHAWRVASFLNENVREIETARTAEASRS